VKNKLIFIVAGAGFLLGLVGAYLFAQRSPAQPPVFTPASNPFAQGIYATGMVESYQDNGANINIYPEVGGTVVRILVSEGQAVQKGAALVELDDSVQSATVAQQRSQAEAAQAMLEELKAQPRREALRVSGAQVQLARASLKTAQDQLDKQNRSFDLDPRSVSRDTLDSARNAVQVAQASLELAQRQFDLTQAGAWGYDIRNQERQYEALKKAYAASSALLAKYTLRAPVDGVVLAVGASVGSYLSPQGVYATYTQGMQPAVVMATQGTTLAVRCYVDEVLVQRLPQPAQLKARMTIRGTTISVPLDFVRIEPYVSPKIQLSNQRTERVDVRVLPVIFRFEKPKQSDIYLGQQVDVYIGSR
jgi:HlyD family secretion protein